MKFEKWLIRTIVLLVALELMPVALGQSTPTPQPVAPPVVISPEVSADRMITFRILAPQAQTVTSIRSDIPAMGQGKPMTKGDKGIWEITIGPIAPGSYRYNFNVNGLEVIDPRNPLVSGSNNNVWSLVHVAGSEFSDTKNVPHGTVASITYYSTALSKFRRKHIFR